MNSDERRARALKEAVKIVCHGREDRLFEYDYDRIIEVAERLEWFISTGLTKKPAGPPKVA